MSTTITETVILTDEEIALLNDVRTLLSDAVRRTDHTWAGGRVSLSFERAEGAIFAALNHANATNVRPMTTEQLHNYAPDAEQS